MNLLESFKMSLSALASNKLRSLLTMLGVIIGVAAVIALVSLGQSAQAQIEAQMTQLGTNLITVNTQGFARFRAGDHEALLQRVPMLAYATPSVTQTATAKARNMTHETRFEGVSHEFLEIRDMSMQVGRFFTEQDVASRRRVAVLGNTVYQQLFEGRGGVGETIMIKGQMFNVIGVAAPKGASMGQDYDDRIFIPYTTAQRLAGTRFIPVIIFKAKSAEVASMAADHLTRILEEKFRNANRAATDPRFRRLPPFRVFSQDEMLNTVSQMTATFTTLLAGIAAVSLLVGGIGIMNIMLVSVTERTREIGIRKAIGAKSSDVLLQFLVESVVISATGGIIGILFGSQMAKFLGSFNEMTVSISPAAIVLAFGFSSAVGVFFGIYPAYKAAKLDPIVALRYE